MQQNAAKQSRAHPIGLCFCYCHPVPSLWPFLCLSRVGTNRHTCVSPRETARFQELSLPCFFCFSRQTWTKKEQGRDPYGVWVSAISCIRAKYKVQSTLPLVPIIPLSLSLSPCMFSCSTCCYSCAPREQEKSKLTSTQQINPSPLSKTEFSFLFAVAPFASFSVFVIMLLLLYASLFS